MMLPKVGESVQYSKEILNASTKRDRYKDKKLEVLTVKLNTINSSGSFYDVYFSDGTSMGIEKDINDRGTISVSGDTISVFEEWGGGYSTPTKNKVVDENNRCSCGTMGEMAGMACKCPNCGTVIWGI